MGGDKCQAEGDRAEGEARLDAGDSQAVGIGMGQMEISSSGIARSEAAGRRGTKEDGPETADCVFQSMA